MQGKLWEYKAFFLSGSFWSHSSTVCDTSASSEDLEHATVVLDGEDEVRGEGRERNLERSKGLGRKNLEKFEGGGETIDNDNNLSVLSDAVEMVAICVLFLYYTASAYVVKVLNFTFQNHLNVPEMKIGFNDVVFVHFNPN